MRCVALTNEIADRLFLYHSDIYCPCAIWRGRTGMPRYGYRCVFWTSRGSFTTDNLRKEHYNGSCDIVDVIISLLDNYCAFCRRGGEARERLCYFRLRRHYLLFSFSCKQINSSASHVVSSSTTATAHARLGRGQRECRGTVTMVTVTFSEHRVAIVQCDRYFAQTTLQWQLRHCRRYQFTTGT